MSKDQDVVFTGVKQHYTTYGNEPEFVSQGPNKLVTIEPTRHTWHISIRGVGPVSGYQSISDFLGEILEKLDLNPKQIVKTITLESKEDLPHAV